MLSDSLTLYKLMILYMLHQARLPLTNSQLADFFLNKEYTNYFTLQQAINDLLEAHLLKQETIRNTSRYELTHEGEDTLNFFGKNISEGILDDINTFLRDNRIRLRNEVGIIADYSKTDTSEYMAQCEVLEGKASLIKLSVSVPTREQAEIICNHWRQESENIYAYIMKQLLKD